MSVQKNFPGEHMTHDVIALIAKKMCIYAFVFLSFPEFSSLSVYSVNMCVSELALFFLRAFTSYLLLYLLQSLQEIIILKFQSCPYAYIYI